MENKNVERRRCAIPACAISEEAGTVTVRLEMPGVPKERLEIKIEGNELSVSGERCGEARGSYLVRERRADSFRKLFTLDDSISREEVQASLENGILTMRLQVKEAAKPKRIEIA